VWLKFVFKVIFIVICFLLWHSLDLGWISIWTSRLRLSRNSN
jgi:hypothetical protein